MQSGVSSTFGGRGLVCVLVALLVAQVFISPCAGIVDVWIEQQKLVRTDGANGDRFGSAVAIDGSYCAIGSDYDDEGGDNAGSATVLFFNGSEWVFDGKLIASDADPGDYFGGEKACAISGTTCIVGAWRDDEKGTDAGGVYVFVRDGSGWTQQAKLLASDGAAGDRFGYAVAIDGDYAVVGAYYDDDNGTSSGSAYVFVRSGSTWTQQTKVSGAASSDYFGCSVSVCEDRMIIGAYQGDAGNSGAGSASVYVRSGTIWSLEQHLWAADGEQWDHFGYSVCLRGERAIVGAETDGVSASGSGSAYVFVRSGSSWSQQAKLTPSDGGESDAFGNAVSISGDFAVVGAYRDDDRGDNSGSAYVFSFDGLQWSEEAKILASDGSEEDRFGYALAMEGDRFVIGAYQADNDKGPDSGTAYIYAFSGGQWTQEVLIESFDGKENDCAGTSVCVKGNRAITGANYTPGGGSADVWSFDGSRWTMDALLTASDRATDDRFGTSVAIDGDYAIVGAPRDDDNGNSSGSVYVFVRDAGGWIQQAKLVASDGAAGHEFGYCVSISGNCAVAGTPYAQEAYVFVRSGSSWTEQQKLMAEPAGHPFGSSVGIDGNTAVVGAMSDIENGSGSGATYVFVRDGSSWTKQAKLLASDGDSMDNFGSSVCISGNTVIVAARQDEGGGSAYIFERAGSVWTEQAKLASDGDTINFGSVAVTGGYAIVGAPTGTNPNTSPGVVYAFAQRGSDWAQVEKIPQPDNATGFGNSVSLSGAYCLIGAPGDDENGTDTGAAYMYSLCSPGDLSGDCVVDMNDVAILGLHWLEGK